MGDSIAKAVVAALEARHSHLGSILRADIAESVALHTRGMVALTPERIGVLSATEVILADEQAAAVISGMLAEARGEKPATRSPIIIDRALFEDLARHDRAKCGEPS